MNINMNMKGNGIWERYGWMKYKYEYKMKRNGRKQNEQAGNQMKFVP